MWITERGWEEDGKVWKGDVVGGVVGFPLYPGGHWFLLNSKCLKVNCLSVLETSKFQILSVIIVFCKIFLMLLLKDISKPGCQTTQILKKFSCSPRELITSTGQILLATGGKEKSGRGWSYSLIPFSFSSPSSQPASQCASKALCSQRQRPCHAVYNSPWMGKCVNSKTLSSLGNWKCVEEHLGCVTREEAAGGCGSTCLQAYEGLLLLRSSGLLCSFLAPYLTWVFDLL